MILNWNEQQYLKKNLLPLDDITIPLPQTPRLSKVFNSGPTSQHNLKGSFDRPERTVHKHNMWFFADDPFTARENQTRSSKGQGHSTQEPRYSSYSGIYFVMAVIDIIWFLHRMFKAVAVARLLLYGYPIFVGIREKTSKFENKNNEICVLYQPFTEI